MERTKQQLDRRTFVKASALTTGGILLAPSMMAAKAHIDGNDVIKIGLIGCGGRGTGAIVQALSSGQNVQLVAMADAFRDRLDNCYDRITDPKFKDWSKDEPSKIQDKIAVPDEHKFDGFDGYKKVIPLCDVVILATPPGFRPMHFEAAVEAGKHIEPIRHFGFHFDRALKKRLRRDGKELGRMGGSVVVEQGGLSLFYIELELIELETAFAVAGDRSRDDQQI